MKLTYRTGLIVLSLGFWALQGVRAEAPPANGSAVPPACGEMTLAYLNGQLEAAERRNVERRDRELRDGAGDSSAIGPHLTVLADCLLRRRDPGFDQARNAGYSELAARIERVFKARSDARLLLVVGLAYVAELTGSVALDVDVWSDIPFMQALLRRSAQLAPDLNGARALIELGSLECRMPRLAGGQPSAGMSQLERAAQLTARGNLSVPLAMAEYCAVALNDRELFERLLRELLEAPSAPQFAATNSFAKQRADYLLQHANVLFP